MVVQSTHHFINFGGGQKDMSFTQKYLQEYSNSNQKKFVTYNYFHNVLMFHQISLSPQVKGCVIVTYKHGIYELPHALPNDLRFRILGN